MAYKKSSVALWEEKRTTNLLKIARESLIIDAYMTRIDEHLYSHRHSNNILKDILNAWRGAYIKLLVNSNGGPRNDWRALALKCLEEILEEQPHHIEALCLMQQLCIREIETFSDFDEDSGERIYGWTPFVRRFISTTLTLVRLHPKAEARDSEERILLKLVFSKDSPHQLDPYGYFLEAVTEDRMTFETLKELYKLLSSEKWRETFKSSNYMEKALQMGKVIFDIYAGIDEIIKLERKSQEIIQQNYIVLRDKIFPKHEFQSQPTHILIKLDPGVTLMEAEDGQVELDGEDIVLRPQLVKLFAFLANAVLEAYEHADKSRMWVSERKIRSHIFSKSIISKSGNKRRRKTRTYTLASETSSTVSELRNALKSADADYEKLIIGKVDKKGIKLNVRPLRITLGIIDQD